MTSLQQVAPHAEHVSSSALQVNAAAATGLLRVLQSNLGPTGTLKLLVGGSVNQLRLTKDGRTLLHEMQIQHPTAALIARSATAQDAVTGDGTTSTVLLAGELLRLAATVVVNTSNAASPYYLHPRHVADGLDIARNAALEFLDTVTVPVTPDVLLCTARTSLSTKLNATLVEKMSHAVVDAVKTIQVPDEPIDLHRIEILTSQRRTATESRLVRGIVLDHGARHPDMPTSLQQCYTLVCNVSLEYEQTETASGFAYSTAAERQALVESERQWLDERCREIIQLKRQVCTGNETFCIFNQKGVDPLALDMFAKEGIFCLRRCKRRNMERLTLACGGDIVLSIKDLDPSVLGRAGRVNQVSYSDDETFTFVEDLEECKSCTLFLQGPNKLTVEQIKDAVKDGLRSCKNAVEDKVVVPGGGAFEIAAAHHLESLGTKGKASLGVQVFKDALLIIPKTLAANSGFDVPDILLQLQQEHASTSMMVGLDCHAGCPMLSAEQGVYDNRRVKRQSLYLATMLANQLLLVDEVMRAGGLALVYSINRLTLTRSDGDLAVCKKSGATWKLYSVNKPGFEGQQVHHSEGKNKDAFYEFGTFAKHQVNILNGPTLQARKTDARLSVLLDMEEQEVARWVLHRGTYTVETDASQDVGLIACVVAMWAFVQKFEQMNKTGGSMVMAGCLSSMCSIM